MPATVKRLTERPLRVDDCWMSFMNCRGLTRPPLERSRMRQAIKPAVTVVRLAISTKSQRGPIYPAIQAEAGAPTTAAMLDPINTMARARAGQDGEIKSETGA